MSFLFQSPALFGLLALAGLPLVVHLLSRARPPVYRFSNLEFMRRVLRRTARIRRPKDRILLILRSLALLALAAAFLLPVLVSRTNGLPGEKRTVVVVVDRSASMNAREGVGSRFDAACAEAAGYLEKVRPDAANVVWIDSEPDAVYPEPGPNLAFLTDTLKKARPKPEEAALAAGLELALRQLADAPGRRELIILSDFQSSAWSEFEPSFPQGIHVIARKVSSGEVPNTAVTRLVTQPTQPIVGQDLTVLVQVQNFSPEPVRTRVTLDADGARQTKEVDCSAWGVSEVAIVLRPAKAGSLPITASLQGDAFPGDDSRYAVVKVRDSLRILVNSSNESPEADLLERVASALSWFEMTGSVSGTGTTDYQVKLGWDGSNPDSVRDLAGNSTTVLVAPAAGCSLESIAALSDFIDDLGPGLLAPDSSSKGWKVLPREDRPVNRLFQSGDFGNPYAGTFRERLKLPKSMAKSTATRLVASYEDGIPAILEIPTDGVSILLWNLAIDSAKSDWSVQGNFLPAIGELLLKLRPKGAKESSDFLPGRLLTWSSSDPAHAGALHLADASDQEWELEEQSTDRGTTWTSITSAVPGIFRWNLSDQPIGYSAVNFPPSESDLRVMTAAPDFGESSARAGSLARHAELAGGVSVWPWLIALALGFLILESLIHLRSKPTQTA